MLWLHIDKSRLQGILQSFYGSYPKNYLSWEFGISIQNMVGYDLLLLMFKIGPQCVHVWLTSPLACNV